MTQGEIKLNSPRRGWRLNCHDDFGDPLVCLVEVSRGIIRISCEPEEDHLNLKVQQQTQFQEIFTEAFMLAQADHAVYGDQEA